MFDTFSGDYVGKYTMYVWAATLMQYHYITFKMSNSVLRLVNAAFLLSTFMLLSAYSGALKSILTVVMYPPPINTFEELARVVVKEDWHVTVCCDNMMFQMGNSSDESKKAVAKRLELNFQATLDFTERAYENVSDYVTGHRRGGQIYATVDTKKSLSLGIRRMLLDDQGYSDVHVMDDCFYDIAIALGLGKNSPYRESIDYKMTQLSEGGFIAKWMADGDISKHGNEVREDKAFSMNDLQGPFLLHILIMDLWSLLASLLAWKLISRERN